MARRESISREGILAAAFELLKEEGMGAVTARRLAARANCSTQPIFRVFKGMDEVEEGLFGLAAAFFEEYYQVYPVQSEVAFVNIGLAYIRFAALHKHVFSLLFVSEARYGKTLYDLINGEKGTIGREMARAKAGGTQDAGGLFMKMWMVIHGAACMSLTGDYDLGEEETRGMLEEVCKSFSP